MLYITFGVLSSRSQLQNASAKECGVFLISRCVFARQLFWEVSSSLNVQALICSTSLVYPQEPCLKRNMCRCTQILYVAKRSVHLTMLSKVPNVGYRILWTRTQLRFTWAICCNESRSYLHLQTLRRRSLPSLSSFSPLRNFLSRGDMAWKGQLLNRSLK